MHNLDQLKQQLGEANFLVNHHQNLLKIYLRDVIVLEQTVSQAQQETNKVSETVPAPAEESLEDC